MGTIPPHFFDRVTLQRVVESIAAALRTGTGFSLVRLGDSEGILLCWPEDRRPDEVAARLKNWFGRSDFPPEDVDRMAEGLRHAVWTADVLGLPIIRQLSVHPRYPMVFEGMQHYNLYSPHQMITDANVHWYMQWSGALYYLLRDRDFVGVIGCRDIGSQIADAFGLASVRMYLVRGQDAFPGPITQPHWPDGFDETMHQLETIRPGSAFLVGAGGLGKIYCDRIKEKGGAAIDIGSVLDGWAGVMSRKRYATNPSLFTLKHVVSVGTDWELMFDSLRKCLTDANVPEAIDAIGTTQL